MSGQKARRTDWYALSWRVPLIVWQGLFFVGPLLFMIAMSFFIVKNYRMEAAFDWGNWIKTLGRPIFLGFLFSNASIGFWCHDSHNAFCVPCKFLFVVSCE